MMRRLSLHTRVGLVFTGLAASLLLVLAALWSHGARNATHEEVEAASRVAEQWLRAMAGEMRQLPPAVLPERVLGVVKPLGRIRANELEVIAADGRLLYRSPAPTYKAGRQVPAWFAGLLTPEFEARRVALGELQLVLHPDASRSVIDAWDDLQRMAAWAVLLLVGLFLISRYALDRALRPLAQVMQALERTGSGRFDTRLPVFATPELGRLSRAFNGMADRLNAAVNDNVRLETEHEVAEQMQGRLQQERQLIARELHDELAQGITAVRALAGAIVQRSSDQPGLKLPAESIVAVTGEMQQGVRHILQRLRPASAAGLEAGLERLLVAWRMQHESIELRATIELEHARLSDAVAQTLIRIVQEGLTNVARHAAASQVELLLGEAAGQIRLLLSDNGRGCDGRRSPQAGCGFGLAGMAERIAELGGVLTMARPAAGGFCLQVCLPHHHEIMEEAS
ncbi:HAMP domain-containing protein [Dechloromonas sp. TW-R-39-2]|uniref:HAMP domain-containing protein n=1 Tax=Dechloromonas sp. TW-R-39-2 TaxID=2654218 RepID=UPI00193CD1DB|nr:HAMP domain-containing protein [Dechloromonas sp. TW-R-39-2]QRM19355.1 HAMP domain-containing protein [Dechloromonas sp. TW-R-39-2]